jgi:uncharacterized membrane protein
MGFWIFLFVSNLLIPLIMILFGSYFKKKAPKTINHVFGYRTTMSMKTPETWVFAHTHCGRIWARVGWALLTFSILAMLLLYGKGIDTIGAWGAALSLIQLLVLILSIIPTELALRKIFDSSGKRRT